MYIGGENIEQFSIVHWRREQRIVQHCTLTEKAESSSALYTGGENIEKFNIVHWRREHRVVQHCALAERT